MSNVRLTDQVGVVGIDGTDYDDEQFKHITTVKGDILLQAAEILDTLGWKEVDVTAVGRPTDDEGYPMLILRPPTDSLFGGEQAGIAVTPRTEQGRRKAVEEVKE